MAACSKTVRKDFSISYTEGQPPSHVRVRFATGVKVMQGSRSYNPVACEDVASLEGIVDRVQRTHVNSAKCQITHSKKSIMKHTTRAMCTLSSDVTVKAQDKLTGQRGMAESFGGGS